MALKSFGTIKIDPEAFPEYRLVIVGPNDKRVVDMMLDRKTFDTGGIGHYATFDLSLDDKGHSEHFQVTGGIADTKPLSADAVSVAGAIVNGWANWALAREKSVLGKVDNKPVLLTALTIWHEFVDGVPLADAIQHARDAAAAADAAKAKAKK